MTTTTLPMMVHAKIEGAGGQIDIVSISVAMDRQCCFVCPQKIYTQSHVCIVHATSPPGHGSRFYKSECVTARQRSRPQTMDRVLLSLFVTNATYTHTHTCAF